MKQPFVTVECEVKRPGFSIPALSRATAQLLRLLRHNNAGILLLLVSDRRIRSLNRRFLGHDWPTDVIALSQMAGPQPKYDSKTLRYFGDLIISVETARRQAAEYGHGLFYEVCFYMAHGILHMLGYEDRTKKQRERMWKRQARLLKQIGVSKTK